jgi:succinate dehydrogenase/fumarate reductase iron-sulfur protein
MSITVSIRRYDPETQDQPIWVEYTLPVSERMTVLEALVHIYEEIDPTLAFRFGCRFDKCGLCAVAVNGKPRMGCLAPIRDGMKIGPLPGMPVIRDLVIDRARFFEGLQELALFIPEPEDVSEPQVLHQSEAQKKLLGCVECLACNATCPEYDFERNPFAGPYVLTKLAQLHGESRNLIDRRRQVRELGLDSCLGCHDCYCIHGIDISRDVLGVLSEE